MLSTLLDSARTYFYLPIDDEDEDEDTEEERDAQRHIEWSTGVKGGQLESNSPENQPKKRTNRSSTRKRNKTTILDEILAENDLYAILGTDKTVGDPDKYTLRRAYLSRSKASHPDKFPDNPAATSAFQKVAVAYNVLSDPAKKRHYDSQTPLQQRHFDFFNTRPQAEETLRSVILGIFNDFLEGDLEIVRTFLRALNDFSPSLRLREDIIDSVLLSLYSIRERALTCRTCLLTLHSELSQVLELQAAFRNLSYFDLISRSRLTIQLARITVGIPLQVDKALINEVKRRREVYRPSASDPEKSEKDALNTAILPKSMCLVIKGVVVVLERMEKALS